MNFKLFVQVLVVMSLAGCMTTELSTAKQTYDSNKDARIRLYGQNGRPSQLKVMINGKLEEITVGGSMGQAFGSMLGVKGNESIGMPATELSKNPSVHSKFLSGIFFKEFIVPAGSMVSVSNNIISLAYAHAAAYNAHNTNKIVVINTDSCSGNVVTFTPEAGKDYEVAPISSSRTCGVTVYEIH